jgi:predicted metal-dependent phosphoesterase TrpH
MAYREHSLLCELHAHTTFSDGELTLGELVDLYGPSGFDVLCVTDHCVRPDDPWLRKSPVPASVDAGNFDTYLTAIESEALRARRLYDLLVVPGLELTYWHPDPRHAAHAVAVGLRRFVGVEEGLDAALEEARAAGSALIGAHPYPLAQAMRTERGTARFAED